MTVIGSTRLPIADTGRAWDGDAATRRMLEVGVDAAQRGHLFRDPDADPATAAAYKLPFADVIDNTLTIVPRGVSASAGGRGVNRADIPEDQRARIRSRICTIYGRIQNQNEEWPDCPFERDESESNTTASTGQPVSAAAFDDPHLTGPTPVRFGDDGSIIGHIGLHGTCHVGYSSECVTIPVSPTGNMWFHRQVVETDQGPIWTGRITAGGHHAGLTANAEETFRHYDGLVQVAAVRAGSDDHGIWIKGMVADALDPSMDQILRRGVFSGDWRERESGLELVEVLALAPGVNPALSEPGFPVAMHASAGRVTAMTAAVGPGSPGAEHLDVARIVNETLTAKADWDRRQILKSELAGAASASEAVERSYRRGRIERGL